MGSNSTRKKSLKTSNNKKGKKEKSTRNKTITPLREKAFGKITTSHKKTSPSGQNATGSNATTYHTAMNGFFTKSGRHYWRKFGMGRPTSDNGGHGFLSISGRNSTRKNGFGNISLGMDRLSYWTDIRLLSNLLGRISGWLDIQPVMYIWSNIRSHKGYIQYSRLSIQIPKDIRSVECLNIQISGRYYTGYLAKYSVGYRSVYLDGYSAEYLDRYHTDIWEVVYFAYHKYRI